MTALGGVIQVGNTLRISPQMARELAIAERVCVRPLMRRVIDRETGKEQRVALPCGSTLESVCPSCAAKARALRMQQCAEGWHRSDEPEHDELEDQAEVGEEPGSDQAAPDDHADDEDASRRVRSTRRRDDAADLPHPPVEDRTVGRVFRTPDGHEYRPSMFVTLTLPSYGRIINGVPAEPEEYRYRRAALDAMHFAKLLDRFWQNLRRAAGYKVQYFAVIEPQKRLAPHVHIAIRGAIPRKLLRQVVRATYAQVWWPRHDYPVYLDQLPTWDGTGYCDPSTGARLPTWAEAVDTSSADRDATAAHTLRFGTQMDIAGIIAPSTEADRAIRYLTKYLTKAIAEPLDGTAQPATQPATGNHAAADPVRDDHVDRLHDAVRWLPCSPRCANWLRYGVQPQGATPGLEPGYCSGRAHTRLRLGIGGRRVLVSRQWSGKTLSVHRADRAAVVREALLSAGVVAPDVERMAADVKASDGHPRYVWTDTDCDPLTYARVILASVAERRQWRQQYDQAKHVRLASPPRLGTAHSAVSPPAM